VRTRPPRACAAVNVHRIPKGGIMPELPTLHLVSPLVSPRLVKVPDAAPPYDCQIHGDRCPRPDTDQTDPSEVDAAPAVALSAPGLPGAELSVAELPGAELPGAALPGAELAGAELAGAELAGGAKDPATARPRQAALVIVEVLAGVRPDRQLVPLATERVRARVRGLAPLLASERRPRIARVVTSQPAARIVEMTVVASFGPRSRALAMRFEHVSARPAAPGWPARPPRWLCTAIEAG
jgi:hypothetical protein